MPFHSAAPGSSPKHTIYAFINLLKCVMWKMTKINEKRPGLAHFEGIYVKNVITSFKNINKRRKLAQKKVRRTLVLSNVGAMSCNVS